MRALGNAPNPFNGGTEIRFELATGGKYEVVVSDLGGRVVRRFAGEAPAGLHRVHWDGRNQDGAPASSGVYQARVRTTDGSDQQSMVLVR